jgi:hypothetical protein
VALAAGMKKYAEAAEEDAEDAEKNLNARLGG